MAKWKAAAVAFLMSITFSPSWAATTATVQSTGDYDPNHCGFWGDSVTLVVTQDNRPSIKYNFCSAYGKSKVLQVIKDRAGETYILLEYGEGHGTRATSTYLEVYSLKGDRLNDRGGELLDEPAAFAVDWVYTYAVVLSPRGGEKLTFKLHEVALSDSNSPPLPAWESDVGLPPALEKVIWVDAHP
jgi:hypothetical protein